MMFFGQLLPDIMCNERKLQIVMNGLIVCDKDIASTFCNLFELDAVNSCLDLQCTGRHSTESRYEIILSLEFLHRPERDFPFV